MNISKLDELIVELRDERDKIDRAIEELQSVKKRLSNGREFQGVLRSENPPRRILIRPRLNPRTKGSYVSIAVEVLKNKKTPMHVSDLVTLITETKGVKEGVITRASVEAALIRALNSKMWRGVLRKAGPSTFTVEGHN